MEQEGCLLFSTELETSLAETLLRDFYLSWGLILSRNYYQLAETLLGISTCRGAKTEKLLLFGVIKFEDLLFI